MEEIKKRGHDDSDDEEDDEEREEGGLDSPDGSPLNIIKGLATCDPGASPTVAQKSPVQKH